MTATATGPSLATDRVRATGAILRESLAVHGGLWLLAAGLLVFLTLPLATLLIRSVEDKAGMFVGVANFVQYVQSPALARSTGNTLVFAVLTTLMTIPLAFVFAYAIQRSCIPGKGVWRSIALIPILAPSLLAALSFIYLFGNQGALKFVLGWFGLAVEGFVAVGEARRRDGFLNFGLEADDFSFEFLHGAGVGRVSVKVLHFERVLGAI